MAWFIFAPVAAIIGMGYYEENRKEEKRRYDIEVQLRREENGTKLARIFELNCRELTEYIAECKTRHPDMCDFAIARYRGSNCK